MRPGNWYLVFICIILTILEATAQPSRYWNINLDAESSLMGGAVISGDLGGPGSIYYNPAQITGDFSSNFSFNASLGTLSVYRADNYLYTDNRLEESNLYFAPKFFSFFYQPEKRPGLAFELSTFVKDFSEFDVGQGDSRLLDIYPDIEGLEQLDDYLQVRNDYQEYWYGLGASYKLSERLQVGSSFFVVHKRLRDIHNFTLNAYSLSEEVIIDNDTLPRFVTNYTSISRVKISNYRVLMKFGMTYRLTNWAFGVTLSTPSLNGLSFAESDRTLSLINYYNAETGRFEPDLTKTGSEGDLSGVFKDPFSVSLGITYESPNERTVISSAYEYFAPINEYWAIEASDVFLSYPYGASSVHNLALGVRQKTWNENYMMLGFRTDFDFVEDLNLNQDIRFNSKGRAHYDVYHISGGGKFKVLKNYITLGVQYSFGRDPAPEYSLIENTEPELPTFEELPDSRYMYDSFSIFAGFTLNFGRDLASMLENKIIK